MTTRLAAEMQRMADSQAEIERLRKGLLEALWGFRFLSTNFDNAVSAEGRKILKRILEGAIEDCQEVLDKESCDDEEARRHSTF